MIRGIGIDMLTVSRMAEKLENREFCNRLFTPIEQKELAARGWQAETAAGRFCAKEAVTKALGLSMSVRMLTQIEITRKNGEATTVKLMGETFQDFSGRILVSVSHEKGRAIAVAIWDEE